MNYLIIFFAIDEIDNVLVNQLSQIVSMEFNMILFTLGNTVISNLKWNSDCHSR
jgi:hypothetical protein